MTDRIDELFNKNCCAIGDDTVKPVRFMHLEQFRAAVAEILREERKKLLTELRSCKCGLKDCWDKAAANRIEKWWADQPNTQRESGKPGGGE